MELDPDLGLQLSIEGIPYARVHPQPDVRAFWEGAEKGELRLRKCKACGAFLHPGKIACTKCLSQELEWVKSSGKGTIYSLCKVNYVFTPEVEGKLPYFLALIKLEEGVYFFGIILKQDAREPSIEMSVKTVFDSDNFFERPYPKFVLV